MCTFHVYNNSETCHSTNGHLVQNCVFVPFSCTRTQLMTTKGRIIFFFFFPPSLCMHTPACTNKCNHTQMNCRLVSEPRCQHQYRPLLSLSPVSSPTLFLPSYNKNIWCKVFLYRRVLSQKQHLLIQADAQFIHMCLLNEWFCVRPTCLPSTLIAETHSAVFNQQHRVCFRT